MCRVLKRTHACALQALKLLGKFGGRNRRFLMDPLELELKSNPEHGLRLILTFQPATSFLVPLDRCLALASQNLFSTNCKSLLPPFKSVGLPPHCQSRASNKIEASISGCSLVH